MDDPVDLRRALSDSPAVEVVLAHLMLGTVSSVKGALDLVLTREFDDSTREGLLKLAARRLDLLARQLKCVSAGVPSEAFALSANHDEP